LISAKEKPGNIHPNYPPRHNNRSVIFQLSSSPDHFFINPNHPIDMVYRLFLVLLMSPFALRAQPGIQFLETDSPQVFGPGIISDGFSNRDMAISPDGMDLYYTIQWGFGSYSVILHSHKEGEQWSKPETAWFSGRFNDLEPAFSPDGNKFYFTSNRPWDKSDSSKKDYDIWVIEKKGTRWGDPLPLDTLINTPNDEFYPSVAKNGNLYFTRDNEGSKDDIFISRFVNGKYTRPVALPETVNSKGYDFNAFVDPDERFLIFSSYKRSDDLGGGDLYYCLNDNGSWKPAVHFGKEINSASLDYSPFVTADKRYFFFTSKKQLVKFPFAQQKTSVQIREILGSYGNGNDDIYIVRFGRIEAMMK
jgi:Tol biopolymer transport system component